MRGVDSGLDRAFAAAETGIDAYLDWYFSFIGSYTRLGALVIPDLDRHMRQQFSTRVFADSGFEQNLARLGAEADATLLGRIAAEAEVLGQAFAQQMNLQPCLHEVIRPVALQDLGRDPVRLALSAAVALPLSRAVLPLALRAGEAVLARAAARQTGEGRGQRRRRHRLEARRFGAAVGGRGHRGVRAGRAAGAGLCRGRPVQSPGWAWTWR